MGIDILPKNEPRNQNEIAPLSSGSIAALLADHPENPTPSWLYSFTEMIKRGPVMSFGYLSKWREGKYGPDKLADIPPFTFGNLKAVHALMRDIFQFGQASLGEKVLFATELARAQQINQNTVLPANQDPKSDTVGQTLVKIENPFNEPLLVLAYLFIGDGDIDPGAAIGVLTGKLDNPLEKQRIGLMRALQVALFIDAFPDHRRLFITKNYLPSLSKQNNSIAPIFHITNSDFLDAQHFNPKANPFTAQAADILALLPYEFVLETMAALGKPLDDKQTIWAKDRAHLSPHLFNHLFLTPEQREALEAHLELEADAGNTPTMNRLAVLANAYPNLFEASVMHYVVGQPTLILRQTQRCMEDVLRSSMVTETPSPQLTDWLNTVLPEAYNRFIQKVSAHFGSHIRQNLPELQRSVPEFDDIPLLATLLGYGIAPDTLSPLDWKHLYFSDIKAVMAQTPLTTEFRSYLTRLLMDPEIPGLIFYHPALHWLMDKKDLVDATNRDELIELHRQLRSSLGNDDKVEFLSRLPLVDEGIREKATQELRAYADHETAGQKKQLAETGLPYLNSEKQETDKKMAAAEKYGEEYDQTIVDPIFYVLNVIQNDPDGTLYKNLNAARWTAKELEEKLRNALHLAVTKSREWNTRIFEVQNMNDMFDQMLNRLNDYVKRIQGIHKNTATWYSVENYATWLRDTQVVGYCSRFAPLKGTDEDHAGSFRSAMIRKRLSERNTQIAQALEIANRILAEPDSFGFFHGRYCYYIPPELSHYFLLNGFINAGNRRAWLNVFGQYIPAAVFDNPDIVGEDTVEQLKWIYANTRESKIKEALQRNPAAAEYGIVPKMREIPGW